MAKMPGLISREDCDTFRLQTVVEAIVGNRPDRYSRRKGTADRESFEAEMPSIVARTTYFGAFTTPSRLAFRKALKYKKSNPITSKARRIASRRDCRAKLRAGPARNVAPHPSRDSEVWKVLSSAMATLMLVIGRIEANAC
jgi:hypothetical protein